MCERILQGQRDCKDFRRIRGEGEKVRERSVGMSEVFYIVSRSKEICNLERFGVCFFTILHY